ncbi:fasciclin domain-containing protein [Senna tora]|uniref:Fasciclin domain-containing protein n=1 Tax=Senna tora TaxID=362788 RepID=A0A834U2C3_9FABA|nr:fasciclin domain-containing protein [Senna tora]
MRRRLVLKRSIALVGMLVCVSCLLIAIGTILKLPDATTRNDSEIGFYHPTFKSRKVPQNFKLGKFGEMMIEMLPPDLAFTVFLPSEEAFKRDLRLSVTEGLRPEKFNDTYAILTRILGFSAVPRALSSVDVPLHELVSHDSLSGFQLYIAKDVDGMLVVNRIRSEMVDIRKRQIVFHIMEGVIMDADFEQSVVSDDTEED